MLRAPLSNIDPATALGWMTFATLAGGAAFGTFTWWWTVERPRRLDLRRQLELMSANQRRAKRQLEQLESDLERAREELSEQRERTTRAEDMSGELGTLSRAVDVLQQAGPAPELLEGLARVSTLLERHDTAQTTHFRQLEATLDARLGEQLERLDSEFERLSRDLAELAELPQRSGHAEPAEDAGTRVESDPDPLGDPHSELEPELPAPELQRALLAEQRVAALATEQRELEARMRQPGQLLALMDALEAESDLSARARLLRSLEAGIAEARAALRP